MGKTPQSDLKKSKLTLAVIHLLGAVGASGREKVHALLSHPAESGGELEAMLLHHGSLDYAQEYACRYVLKATEALKLLPPGDAKDALIATAHFMVNRAA